MVIRNVSRAAVDRFLLEDTIRQLVVFLPSLSSAGVAVWLRVFVVGSSQRPAHIPDQQASGRFLRSRLPANRAQGQPADQDTWLSQIVTAPSARSSWSCWPN